MTNNEDFAGKTAELLLHCIIDATNTGESFCQIIFRQFSRRRRFKQHAAWDMQGNFALFEQLNQSNRKSV